MDCPATWSTLANTNRQTESDKMKARCAQCHGKKWIDNHYAKLDRAIKE